MEGFAGVTWIAVSVTAHAGIRVIPMRWNNRQVPRSLLCTSGGAQPVNAQKAHRASTARILRIPSIVCYYNTKQENKKQSILPVSGSCRATKNQSRAPWRTKLGHRQSENDETDGDVGLGCFGSGSVMFFTARTCFNKNFGAGAHHQIVGKIRNRRVPHPFDPANGAVHGLNSPGGGPSWPAYSKGCGT